MAVPGGNRFRLLNIEADDPALFPTGFDAPAAGGCGSFVPPMPLEELLGLKCLPLVFIPARIKALLAAALQTAFVAPLRGGERWWLILSFGRLVASRRTSAPNSLESLAIRAKAFGARQWPFLIQSLRAEDAILGKRAAHRVEFTRTEDPSHFSPYDVPEECEKNKEGIARCIRLAKAGCMSKAMAALSPSPIAPWTPSVLAALRVKHPAAEDSGISAEQKVKLKAADAPMDTHTEEVMKCLRRFPPASGSGPSGISPSLLLSLASFPGSPLRSVLAPVVSDIITGRVHEDYKKFVFGAKLVPLLKKDKALRPIACSEALRRLAGKILASRLATRFREVLTPHGQIGVAVSSGLEALASWCRRAALELRDDEVVAKVDYANAFNSVARSAIASAVLEHVPELSRYVLGAYGEPSLLFCEGETISSEVGAQQGDPLGPVLFSLAALAATSLPAPLRSNLRGVGWYLDDGLLVGKADDVHEALETIRAQSAKIGLRLNVTKTEILGRRRSAWSPSFAASYPLWRDLSDLELLGLPCAPDEEGTLRYLDKFQVRLSQRTSTISEVAKEDPHVGFLLLRMCTGFSASVHLARAMGPVKPFAVNDAEVVDAMDSIVPLSERGSLLARLPFRLGGLGLRSTARHAATAFIAASLATAPLMVLFSKSPLLPDPLFIAVSDEIPLCAVNIVAEKAALSKPELKTQRAFSKVIDDADLAALCPTDDERIRINSCGSQGASLYLVGPLTYDNKLSEFFFEPLAFTTAVKLRLGQDVQPDDDICPLCANHPTDKAGHSALMCMKCGARSRAHNALRNCLSGLCRDALVTPDEECHPFPAQAGLRLDLMLPMSGKAWLIDVAITHPFRPGNYAAALRSPGGAATAYQSVKVAKYGKYVKEDIHKLAPFVLDTFGALGESALEVARRIVPLYQRRLGLSSSVASRIVFGRLTSCVVKWMARIASQTAQA